MVRASGAASSPAIAAEATGGRGNSKTGASWSELANQASDYGPGSTPTSTAAPSTSRAASAAPQIALGADVAVAVAPGCGRGEAMSGAAQIVLEAGVAMAVFGPLGLPCAPAPNAKLETANSRALMPFVGAAGALPLALG